MILKCVGFKKSEWKSEDGVEHMGVKMSFAVPIPENEGKGFNVLDKYFDNSLLSNNNVIPDLKDFDLDFTLSSNGLKLSNIHNVK